MRKIKHFKVHSLKAIIIDNFFNNAEYNELLEESLFLLNNDLLEPPNPTFSAKDKNENLLRNNTGLFLDLYYNENRSQSKILTLTRQLFSPEVCEELLKIDYFYHYFLYSNTDCTMLNYYEDNEFYKPHTDSSVITTLFWLFKSPKSFKGGDLILNHNKKIKCLSNRLVIFPSIITHEVTKVSIPTHLKNQGNGRFCITNFVLIKHH